MIVYRYLLTRHDKKLQLNLHTYFDPMRVAKDTISPIIERMEPMYVNNSTLNISVDILNCD